MERRADQTRHARLLQANFLKKHLSLLISLKLSNLRLCLRRHDKNLSILVFRCLTHHVNIFVAIDSRLVVDVAHIKHRLVGEQEKVVGGMLLVLGVECHRARRLALVESLLEAAKHLILYLSLLVATGLRLFLHARDAALDSLKVFQLQFVVDDFLVAHRVYRAVDMHHVRVIETTQHVDYGIGLTDVCQELVAETLAFRRAFNQTRDVDNLDRGGHDALRIDDSGKFVQAVVGHTDYADVWLDCTKRKVCRLRLGVRQAVEKSGLANVRQSDNTTL